jgi:hypothetical protein
MYVAQCPQWYGSGSNNGNLAVLNFNLATQQWVTTLYPIIWNGNTFNGLRSMVGQWITASHSTFDIALFSVNNWPRTRTQGPTSTVFMLFTIFVPNPAGGSTNSQVIA